MNPPPVDGQRELAALKRAVAQALDRKRRLGHYAVVWKDGRVVRLEPRDITPDMTAAANRTRA